MTMNSPNYLQLPDPNDEKDINRHQEAVLDKFGDMFALTDSALRDSIPKAKNMFALFNGSPDRAVHAMNTRYLMKVFLNENEVAAQEKSFDGDLNIEWVPNCGLYVKLPEAEFRILKTGPWGIPKATSIARSKYYKSNQMLLGFNQNKQELISDPALSLVLLWDINDEYNYLGLEIACPRTTNSDDTVDCYWITKWNDLPSIAVTSAPIPQGPDQDLEGITRIETDKSRSAAKA
jgi:hypothetical protein